MMGWSVANEWQEYCTAELKKCIDLGRRGEAFWSVRRWQLHEESKLDPRAGGRIIIADLDASDLAMRRYSFFACYLVRCNFSNTNLSRSDFDLSIIRECSFKGSNLTLSSFEDADIEGDNDFRDVTVTNGRISFSVKYITAPSKMDSHLRRTAETAREIVEAQRNEGSRLANLFRMAIGHGLRLKNIALAAASIVLAYAVIWMFAPIAENAPAVARVGAALLVSGRYFLGLTDQFSNAFDGWGLLGLTETCFGLFFLALLVAAVTRRFTVTA